MPRKKPYNPQKTGVSFHPVILRYLDQICLEEGLGRSDMVTRVIKFYAEQHGTRLDLTAAAPEEARKAA
jgi:hypothetical protein